MTTNIIILAAGKTPVSGSPNDDYPMCLTEINGLSLVERIVINASKINNPRFTFAVLDKEAKRFHLDNIFSVLVENSRTVRIPEGTKGSACTALLSAIQLEKEAPLLIISANELVDIDYSIPINHFETEKKDVGMIAFNSIHPRYSFVRLNDNKEVIQVAQKNPISKHATSGIFWFKRTEDFIEAAMSSIRKGADVDGQYYVAPTVNELILKQLHVGIYEIEGKMYKPLKTVKQLSNFETGGVS